MSVMSPAFSPYPAYRPYDVPRLDNVPAIGPWLNLEALGDSLKALAEQRNNRLPQAVVVILHNGRTSTPITPYSQKIPLDIPSHNPVH